MIFSRSTQYAIQALVLLAGQPAGSFMMSRSLATRLQLPEAYLSKLMVRFAQAGILESIRGRQGGYRLRASPFSVNLMQVVEVVNGDRVTRECLLGLKDCADDSACAMHCHWKPLKQGLFTLLEEQNLGALAEGVAQGRYRLEDINAPHLATGASAGEA